MSSSTPQTEAPRSEHQEVVEPAPSTSPPPRVDTVQVVSPPAPAPPPKIEVVTAAPPAQSPRADIVQAVPSPPPAAPPKTEVVTAAPPAPSPRVDTVRVISPPSPAPPSKIEVITAAPPAYPSQSSSASPMTTSPVRRETQYQQLQTIPSASSFQQLPPNVTVQTSSMTKPTGNDNPFNDTMHVVERPQEEQIVIVDPAPTNQAYAYPQRRSQSPDGSHDKILLVLVALLCPPVAVYMCRGCSWQIGLNIFLLLLLHFPAVIHAIILICSDKNGDGLTRSERKEARKLAEEELRLAERDARRVSFA